MMMMIIIIITITMEMVMMIMIMLIDAGDDDNDDDDDARHARRFLLAAATLKHLTAYSLEDWSPSGNFSDHTFTRQTFDANVSLRDLNDTYLPAFRTAVVEGGAVGVMCVAVARSQRRTTTCRCRCCCYGCACCF